MWQVQAGGQSIPLDSPFTVEDINYPANWLRLASPAERAAIGLVELPDPEPVPPPVLPPQPDYLGFLHWMPTSFTTPEILTMNAAYVSFPWFVQYGNAAGVAYCIIDALAKTIITPAQYALFQQAVQTYHLPVELP